MTRTLWPFLALLAASLIFAACAGETTDSPTPSSPSTAAPFQPSTPIPTADLESVVRRVLAEARAAEPTPETPEPAPTIDAEALAFEVTERVLATLEARQTPTPEPTPEPTPTETPIPAPTLPDVIRTLQKSILRVTSSGRPVATGVIVSVDDATGDIYLLTRYSRIANVVPLEAATTSGTKFEAAISGVDEVRDIALLRLCCDAEAVHIPLGDALTMQIGTEVTALAFGPESAPGLSASRGIVSSILFDSERQRWIIQTDAPVFGDGGAALITYDGRLVGLVVESDGAFSHAVSEVTLSEILPSLR